MAQFRSAIRHLASGIRHPASVMGHGPLVIVLFVILSFALQGAVAQAPAPAPEAPAATPPLVLVLPFQPDETARGEPFVGYAAGMVVESILAQSSGIALVPGGDWGKVIRSANALRGMVSERQLTRVAQAVGARWVVLGTYSIPTPGAVSLVGRVWDAEADRGSAAPPQNGKLDDLFILTAQTIREVFSLLSLPPTEFRTERAIASEPLLSLAQAARAIDQALVADIRGDISSGALYDSAMALVSQVLAEDSAVDPLMPSIESLCRAVRQDHPNHVGAIVNLGFIHYKRGDMSAALAAFTEASRLAPKEPQIFNFLGLTYRARGELEPARDAYQQAVQLDPKFAMAYNNLGYVYDELGDYDHAVSSYRQAIELDNDPKAKLLAQGNLGVALMNHGELEAALDAFDAALALDPNHADTLYNRGLALQQLGRRDEAQEAYQAALKLDPNHARAHNNLGILLYQRGEAADAAKEYQRALELDASLNSAHRNLAIVLEDLERWADATKEWQAYLQGDGSIPQEDRRVARQHIQYIRQVHLRGGGQ